MIDYRDATPADATALDTMAQAIWVETFGHTASPDNIAAYLGEAYGPQGKLIRDLREHAARFRIALDRDRIVGYAKLNIPWLPNAELGAMQLSQIYVDYAHHGSGVGQILLDWAIDAARDAKASALLLTVWENNHRAFRFYVKNGFDHVGDYAFPVGKQVDTDHVMRLGL